MKGSVYVVGNSVASKIGYSANPQERVRVVGREFFGD